MKMKKILRLKKIKVLRGGYVRFDTIPTQGSPIANGIYINSGAWVDGKKWPGIEEAKEIKVTIEVIK